MPKESLPTTSAGFGVNNVRVIVCAMDGTQYPDNKRIAQVVMAPLFGCRTTHQIIVWADEQRIFLSSAPPVRW